MEGAQLLNGNRESFNSGLLDNDFNPFHGVYKAMADLDLKRGNPRKDIITRFKVNKRLMSEDHRKDGLWETFDEDE